MKKLMIALLALGIISSVAGESYAAGTVYSYGNGDKKGNILTVAVAETDCCRVSALYYQAFNAAKDRADAALAAQKPR